jgi:hypothetical protein
LGGADDDQEEGHGPIDARSRDQTLVPEGPRQLPKIRRLALSVVADMGHEMVVDILRHGFDLRVMAHRIVRR